MMKETIFNIIYSIDLINYIYDDSFNMQFKAVARIQEYDNPIIIQFIKDNLISIIFCTEIQSKHVEMLIESLINNHKIFSNYYNVSAELPIELKSLINNLDVVVKLKQSDYYPHIVSFTYTNYNDSLVALNIIHDSTIRESYNGIISPTLYEQNQLRAESLIFNLVTLPFTGDADSFLAYSTIGGAGAIFGYTIATGIIIGMIFISLTN